MEDEIERLRRELAAERQARERADGNVQRLVSEMNHYKDEWERANDMLENYAMVRTILAGSDITSLPNDYATIRMAQDRMEDIERAEAELAQLRAECDKLKDDYASYCMQLIKHGIKSFGYLSDAIDQLAAERDAAYELLSRCALILSDYAVDAEESTIYDLLAEIRALKAQEPCDHGFHEHISNQIQGPVRCQTCGAIVTAPSVKAQEPRKEET